MAMGRCTVQRRLAGGGDNARPGGGVPGTPIGVTAGTVGLVECRADLARWSDGSWHSFDLGSAQALSAKATGEQQRGGDSVGAQRCRDASRA